MGFLADEYGQPLLDEYGGWLLDELLDQVLPVTGDTPRNAATYASAFLALLPHGPAWPRDPDAVLPKIAASLSATYERSDARAQYLLEESPVGGELTELISEWETTLGLPDACVGPLPTLQQRRTAVSSKLAARGGQSVPYFVALAAAAGFSVWIKEFGPARAGGMRAGDPCNGYEWAHSWQAVLPSTTTTYFAANQSTAGEPLATWGNTMIQCLLQRYAPAHTALTFAYTSGN